ncbi:Tat pathway signal protein [Kitasatospora sp. NPDC001261]|uniref:Tat pathway signal protein n=1 Tax=Kitasatospora sp. NPDC001261 TaxID=3364012 RepID=UPI0036CBBC4E
MAHERNLLLAAVIKELGWSQEQLAGHFRRIAAEQGADELLSVNRNHIAQWLRGVKPSGHAPDILCATLSRGLGRVITPSAIGLAPADEAPAAPGWDADSVSALADLGSSSDMLSRRQVIGGSVYSAIGAVLPPEPWWQNRLAAAQRRVPLSRLTVSPVEVEAVREAAAFFSSRDQRLGGRAGRAALTTYLRTDVADYMAGRFPSEQVRRDLAAAAGELVYVAGWMDFDAGRQGSAQRGFEVALALAAEADDAPLAGHILRAAAHQAVDLGHPGRALQLAEASMDRRRYGQASSREKSLLGVVHARALAASGRRQDALTALLRAENDLSNAAPAGSGEDPARVGFFGEASLAHETACTLRDLGDLQGAETQFQHSVRTRLLPFARTRAVTLGYLGDVQVRQGHIEAGCATWDQALDAMVGLQSARARSTVVQMRRSLSPVRGRGGSVAARLDRRAQEFLRTVG